MSKPVSAGALRAFEAAVRQGALVRAAQELGVTSTALSHAIKNLEARLDTTLLKRTARGVTPTPAGARLASRLKAAFADIDFALEELEAQFGRVTLAAKPAFASLWLAPRLSDFESTHIGLSLHFEASIAPVDLNRQTHIDLALRYGPPDGPGECVCQDKFRAYAAPSVLHAIKSGRRAGLLAPQWQVLSCEPPAWRDWLDLSTTDFQPGPQRAFEDEEYAVQCALAGQGLLLASDLLVSMLVRRGLLLAFEPEIWLPGPTYRLVGRKEALQSSKVRKLAAWLRTALNQT